MDDSQQVSLSKIFFVFFKIGTVAFGGVYSMLSFFEREIVEKNKWITQEEFIESVAIGQMTPGPPIVNIGICIGYKLRKLRGAVVTVLGQAFTGTILAIVLAICYVKTRDTVFLGSFLKGVAAAVIGLLFSITFKMGRQTIKNGESVLFASVAFAGLAFFKANPIAIILTAGLAGLLVCRRRKR